MYYLYNSQVCEIFMKTQDVKRVLIFLNWSTREKECYGIYYGVKLFEDLLDNRYFVIKTDHMNLTYINVTFTGRVQDKDFSLYHVSGTEEHQFVPVLWNI